MNEKRSIHLLDAGVFIAFTAVGLGLCKAYDAFNSIAWAPLRGAWVPLRRLTVPTACECVTSLLMAWSVAYVLMRLRKPRPVLRQCLCYAGTSATFTSFIMLISLLIAFIRTPARLGPPEEFVEGLPAGGPERSLWTGAIIGLYRELGSVTGMGVVAVWAVLALAGLLRFRGGGWPEAFGAVLGLGWIILLFGPAFAYLVWPF
jgi:hypothetical protein